MSQGNIAGLNFNASEEEEFYGEYEPLPNGEYLAIISDSEIKETKSGEGGYIKLTFEVQDPISDKGRKVFTNLNIYNKSQDAVKIARAELAAICRAIGVSNPQDTKELHDIPVVIKVKITKQEYNGEEKFQNKIIAYKSKSEKSEENKSQSKGLPWKK